MANISVIHGGQNTVMQAWQYLSDLGIESQDRLGKIRPEFQAHQSTLAKRRLFRSFDRNRLTGLPEEFFRLENLVTLDLERNNLYIPSFEFDCFEKLKDLRL